MVTMRSLSDMLEAQIKDADSEKRYGGHIERAKISAMNAQAIAQAMIALATFEKKRQDGNA